ncbi:hypothetical protein ODV15_08005, partial [Lactobacillus amylovorus]
LIPLSIVSPPFKQKYSKAKKAKPENSTKITKKGRIHHRIKIPCFLRSLFNKKDIQDAENTPVKDGWINQNGKRLELLMKIEVLRDCSQHFFNT